MPAIINTNIASLNAQRNLNSSQSALQTSLQRLSSGLRINSAKDDAAGLAISERFSTQIRGLNQAARNANDGISLAQTGEGALAAVTDNLQRIRELAVQAANSTNSADDRAALQLEVAQRLAEIDRTASQTSFNGQKLLDGSFTAAAFQIGANAGETISVEGLGTGVRLSATGQIAQATSGVIASAATNGRIAVTPTGTLNFGTAGSVATAGSTGSIALTGLNFGTAGQAAVAGSNASTTTGVLDFSTPASAQVDASVVIGGGAMTAFDYSGAGLAQFDVNIAGSATPTVGITLNQAYADGAALAADIQAQIRATAGNTAVTVGFAGGNLTITNTGKTGAGNAVTIANPDANASLATHDFDVSAPSNGSAATAGTTATFTVTNGVGNGVAITLNGVYADQNAVAAAIQAQFALDADTASMTATNNAGVITFTNVGSPTAVAISASNQAAINAGFVSDAGTAGNATVTTTNAQFTVDGGAKTINLTQNYANQAALLADIQTQIGAQGGGLTVSAVDATHIKFDRTTTGVASTAVSVALGAGQAGVNAGAAGVAVAAGTAGANAVTTTNATFYVDGNAVTLNANYADQNAVATAIGTQLAGAGYTAAFAAGQITIQKTGSLAAVSITGADTNATAAGFAFATGVAGTSSGSVTLAAGALTVAGTAVAAGTYANVAALATYINANASGVYASEGTGADAGKLVVTSSAALTLGGTAATTTLGFAATSFAANSGTLATATVATAADANLTIQRIDSALTAVSNLRSTFGAVQNRFESVISSLSATSENLTAARSRIQDTDFAAETAQLTRNQILQQAGTAMLAQANQLPNTVLSLLR